MPVSHAVPLQHPDGHEVESHTQTSLWHRSPLGQAPSPQVPAHPSLAPQALPAQSGVQPQTPLVPPPPQLSGEAQPSGAQHGSPLPPQVAQAASPQAVPSGQTMHAAPPLPHSVSSVPDSQTPPLQQPAHDVASQVHAPLTQWLPSGHEPPAQVPEQPSLAPQALPAQLGTQGPVPQTFGPRAPQVMPAGQALQVMVVPQRFCSAPH